MSQPEARLSRNIMAALRQRGAFVFKVWGNEKMMAGLPDIIGVHRGQFIAVETKIPGNTISRVQGHVIRKLLDAGARVVIAYSVSDALRVLDPSYSPGDASQALTDALRASNERPVSRRPVRGASHVAELLSGERFID